MLQLNRRTFLLGGVALGAGMQRPPAADVPLPIPAALRNDDRLARPVTLSLKRNPLSEVLAALAGQTGVRLEAAGIVADEPAIVFVKEQPARDVMEQLVLLFHYRWRAIGEGRARRYELYQDAAARHEEESLRAREQQELLKALRAQVERYERLSRRPPEELLKELQPLQAAMEAGERRLSSMTQEEQIAAQVTRSWRENRAQLAALRAMADPHQRALLQLVTALTSEQWRALFQEEPLLFSSARDPGTLPIPPAMEQLLSSQLLAWELPGEAPLPASPQFDGVREHRVQMREDRRGAEGYRICIEARLRPYACYITARPGAVLPEKRHSTLPARELRISTAGLHLEDPPTPEVSPEEAARDPLLSAIRRLELARKPETSTAWWSAWLTVVLAGLAKSDSLNLIADGYRCLGSPLPDRSEATSLYEALNQWVLPEARWRRDGAFLRIRRRRWYALRLTEIPERVADRWAAYLRTRRSLTLDETAAWVQAFRDEQLDECFTLAMAERGIRLPEVMQPVVNVNIPWPRPLLRVYAALTEELKRRLKEGQPVAFADMPPAARELLRRALREEMSERPRASNVPPTFEELASGSLRLGLLELQRTVRPEMYGDRAGFAIEYQITRITGGAARGDQPFKEGDGLLRLGASETPPPEGQAVHAVQFRYRLPDARGADFTFILPWVQILPKPGAAP